MNVDQTGSRYSVNVPLRFLLDVPYAKFAVQSEECLSSCPPTCGNQQSKAKSK